eukprot:CAMPEP_0197256876 /NCGR_PEP_ID=MMETSP1429-20130617/76848_1 /TAXON_ID=49237 /ORGANISM="Chaetoceros  sp., Strain UNC1202" /LENGTH=76 /DNA_ID=CAMNT_0042720573 /DNA_START=344 /DNA_END=574 /DNA_ORIENTATION=+
MEGYMEGEAAVPEVGDNFYAQIPEDKSSTGMNIVLFVTGSLAIAVLAYCLVLERRKRKMLITTNAPMSVDDGCELT